MPKPFLKEYYERTVVPELIKLKGYKNKHQIPQVEKIVINSGIRSENDKAWVNEVAKDISMITGRKPVITRAKKSISNFKLREGMPVGVVVTLRGNDMYEFLYRLVSVTLPLIRDFRGLPRRMDGRGNYNLGIADHSIFPEVSIEGNRKNVGMDLTIVTSALTDDEGRELLRLLGFPFRQGGSVAIAAQTATA